MRIDHLNLLYHFISTGSSVSSSPVHSYVDPDQSFAPFRCDAKLSQPTPQIENFVLKPIQHIILKVNIGFPI